MPNVFRRLGDLLVHLINALEHLPKRWVIRLQDFFLGIIGDTLVKFHFAFFP